MRIADFVIEPHYVFFQPVGRPLIKRRYPQRRPAGEEKRRHQQDTDSGSQHDIEKEIEKNATDAVDQNNWPVRLRAGFLLSRSIRSHVRITLLYSSKVKIQNGFFHGSKSSGVTGCLRISICGMA